MCIVNTKQKLSSAFDASVICAVEKFRNSIRVACTFVCLCIYLYFCMCFYAYLDGFMLGAYHAFFIVKIVHYRSKSSYCKQNRIKNSRIVANRAISYIIVFISICLQYRYLTFWTHTKFFNRWRTSKVQNMKSCVLRIIYV